MFIFGDYSLEILYKNGVLSRYTAVTTNQAKRFSHVEFILVIFQLSGDNKVLTIQSSLITFALIKQFFTLDSTHFCPIIAELITIYPFANHYLTNFS